MYLYNHKRRDLRNGVHFLGFILFLASIFVLFSPLFIEPGNNLQKTLWVGTVSFIVGFIIINTYEGTMINLNDNKIKDYLSICGYKTGKWRNLPSVETIKLIPIEQKTTNNPNGISPTFGPIKSSYQIVMCFTSVHTIYTFSYTNKSHAQKQMKFLSEKLLEPEIN